jgi:cellulose synthase/poly-beta-1,6-N-acetylglucosamine synthase-like glycosyltransferase
MTSRFKRIISYFPIRYYAASIFFAFFLINGIDSIRDAQEYAILSSLDVLNIPAFISEDNNLFVGDNAEAAKINLPLYVQLLFLMFFPSLAFTVRANFTSRAKIMLFGLLCFFAFIGVGLSSIVIAFAFDILNSKLLFNAATIIASIVIGCLIIELALFSTIRIPERTKIKPLIKRRYVQEYAYLALFMTTASIVIYSLVMFMHIDIDSPIGEYVHLYLWINMSSVVTLGYLLANVIFEARRPSMLKRIELRESLSKSSAANSRMPFVSFLIPAYNEERIAGRCIESIDKAAAKYNGEVEIIFINDGSSDKTENVVSEAIGNLKHCSGTLFTISNAGKGFALVYGMEKTRGEIIFRTDADSIIDEDALTPMMRHFRDPTVGSVSGWVFPMQDKGVWIKVQNVLDTYYMYTKRAEEVLDSIITQPGPSTSFRREALIKAGSWRHNIFGEDGEITNRISRYGYRELFEPCSIVYSEHPSTFMGILHQRARWSVAFYHSRGANLRLVREIRNPRSLVFLWDLATHGGGLATSLIWPYLLATTISAMLNPAFIAEQSSLAILLAKLFAIQLAIIVIKLVLFGYGLNKVRKLGDIKYYPFIHLMNFMLNAVVKPQVVDVMLFWSSRWKQYNDESFKDLRRVVSKSVDPLYPDGDLKIIISSSSSSKGSNVDKKQERPFSKSAVRVVDGSQQRY